MTAVEPFKIPPSSGALRTASGKTIPAPIQTSLNANQVNDSDGDASFPPLSPPIQSSIHHTYNSPGTDRSKAVNTPPMTPDRSQEDATLAHADGAGGANGAVGGRRALQHGLASSMSQVERGYGTNGVVAGGKRSFSDGQASGPARQRAHGQGHSAANPSISRSNYASSIHSMGGSTSQRPSSRASSVLPYHAANTSPRTHNGRFSTAHRAAHLLRSSASSPHGAGKFLLTVIPPHHLPHDPPHPRTSQACSGYGPPQNFRRGTLVPLYPTLSSQLGAIAREYGLPSTGGLVLYLLSTSDPNSTTNAALPGSAGLAGEGGPRIGEEAWNVLWGRLFEVPEDELLSDGGESLTDDDEYDSPAPPVPPIPLSHRYNPLDDRDATSHLPLKSRRFASEGEHTVFSDGDQDLELENLSSDAASADAEGSLYSGENEGKARGNLNQSRQKGSSPSAIGRGPPPSLPSPVSRNVSNFNASHGSRSLSSSSSQPNLRHISIQSAASNSRSVRSATSRHFPPRPASAAESYASHPLGPAAFGTTVVVGKVEFDIDYRRGGKSKWYENWVEAAETASTVNSSAGPSPHLGYSSTSSAAGTSVDDREDTVRVKAGGIAMAPSASTSSSHSGLRELRSIPSPARKKTFLPTSTSNLSIPDGYDEDVPLSRDFPGTAPDLRIRTASGRSKAAESVGSLYSVADVMAQRQSIDVSTMPRRELFRAHSPSPEPSSARSRSSSLTSLKINSPTQRHSLEAEDDAAINGYAPLVDEDEESFNAEESEAPRASPTLTLLQRGGDPLADVFPSDEATWRSMAEESHTLHSSAPEETTGLGIMGARVEKLASSAPRGVVEHLSKEDDSLPPQNDVAEVVAMLQSGSRRHDSNLASPIHLANSPSAPHVKGVFTSTSMEDAMSQSASVQSLNDSFHGTPRPSYISSATASPPTSISDRSAQPQRKGGIDWASPHPNLSQADDETSTLDAPPPAFHSQLDDPSRASTIGLMENLDDLERALGELSPRVKPPSPSVREPAQEQSRSAQDQFLALARVDSAQASAGHSDESGHDRPQSPPTPTSPVLATRPVHVYPTSTTSPPTQTLILPSYFAAPTSTPFVAPLPASASSVASTPTTLSDLVIERTSPSAPTTPRVSSARRPSVSEEVQPRRSTSSASNAPVTPRTPRTSSLSRSRAESNRPTAVPLPPSPMPSFEQFGRPLPADDQHHVPYGAVFSPSASPVIPSPPAPPLPSKTKSLMHDPTQFDISLFEPRDITPPMPVTVQPVTISKGSAPQKSLRTGKPWRSDSVKGGVSEAVDGEPPKSPLNAFFQKPAFKFFSKRGDVPPSPVMDSFPSVQQATSDLENLASSSASSSPVTRGPPIVNHLAASSSALSERSPNVDAPQTAGLSSIPHRLTSSHPAESSSSMGELSALPTSGSSTSHNAGLSPLHPHTSSPGDEALLSSPRSEYTPSSPDPGFSSTRYPASAPSTPAAWKASRKESDNTRYGRQRPKHRLSADIENLLSQMNEIDFGDEDSVDGKTVSILSDASSAFPPHRMAPLMSPSGDSNGSNFREELTSSAAYDEDMSTSLGNALASMSATPPTSPPVDQGYKTWS